MTGILKDMYDTFAADLEKSNQDESNAQMGFEEVMAEKRAATPPTVMQRGLAIKLLGTGQSGTSEATTLATLTAALKVCVSRRTGAS